MNNLQHFPLYADCQNNYYEIDLLGKSTFKPIPYSSWIKINTQQKPVKQKLYRKDLFPLIEKEISLIISIYQAHQTMIQIIQPTMFLTFLTD